GEEDVPAPQEKKKRMNPFSLFIGTMSSIMAPIVPAICGSGLAMGIAIMLMQFGVVAPDSVAAKLLTVIGNVGFYWLPFYVAATAAERFKCNKVIALVLVGVLMHPGFMGMVGGEVESLYLFDLIPIRLMDYSSNIIPPIVLVYMQSKFEKWLYKVIPTSLQMVIIPFAEIFLLGSIGLILVGPVTKIASDLLAQGYLWLYNIAAIPVSAAFAALYPFMVLMGIHTSLGVVMHFSLAEFGIDYLMPLMSIAHCGLAAAALAVFIKTKNSKLKGVAANGALITGIGLTEPALFGVFLPFKRIMVVCLISNAIGGAFYGLFKVTALGIGGAPLGAMPIFFTDTFVYWAIGAVGTAVLAFLGTWLFGYRRGDEDTVPGYEKKKAAQAEAQTAATA
ncbi:PTS transporter subunit EIIC, partial [Ruminococcaceae bacterium OttesenSCG-928-D13]|nr:PTS transporter subunit EIIC [Ruminococcaceae bacterium OttesenSCG-928-D13]